MKYIQDFPDNLFPTTNNFWTCQIDGAWKGNLLPGKIFDNFSPSCLYLLKNINLMLLQKDVENPHSDPENFLMVAGTRRISWCPWILKGALFKSNVQEMDPPPTTGIFAHDHDHPPMTPVLTPWWPLWWPSVVRPAKRSEFLWEIWDPFRQHETSYCRDP